MAETPKTKDLLYEIGRLKKQVAELKTTKAYGLVWEDKPEKFDAEAENALPVLQEKGGKFKDIELDPSSGHNVLIEGDNYHALSVLNYTHSGKIDVIYIDPPYNTGAADWKYNNDYVDVNDTFRHSKWLSFMSKRLELAKNLLKSTGIIVVTIDDYEIATLRLLMNDIFGLENYLGTVAIRNNPSGRSTVSGFSVNHEYALFYSRTSAAKIGRLPHNEEQVSRYKEKDENGYFEWENFRKNGTDSDRADRPKQFYPLVINKSTHKLRVPKIRWNTPERKYDFHDKLEKNEEVVLPINDGNEKVWKFGLERMSTVVDELLVKRKNGVFELYRKKYLSEDGSLPRTWWDKPGYSARDNGTRTLTEILGVNNKFDFPKAPDAVEDCIRVANAPSNGILLDFFAGSGTTGHAVLEMNKMDGGNRSFILCSNNENSICEDVTYERVKQVMKGYTKASKEKVAGLGGNLKYLKTAFVAKHVEYGLTDEARLDLTRRANLLLALKENTFTPVESADRYEVFSSPSCVTGIYFTEDKVQLDEMLKSLKTKARGKTVVVYIFSWEKGSYKAGFEDYPDFHFEDIPEPILDVYRSIGY